MTDSALKNVIIHADDLGMSHGANAAFAELCHLGACSSGSVMVPCPWFVEVATMARAARGLDLGVHLTLTSEMSHYKWRPLTASPRSAGMTDSNGMFLADVASLRASAEPEAVEAELRAQIEMALSAGIDVTHLDDHAGAVLAPEFCDIYVRLGLEYALPILITPSLATYGGIHNLQGVRDADFRKHAEVARTQGFHMFDRIIETPWQRLASAEKVYRELINGIAPGLTFMALHFTKPGEIEVIDPQNSRIRTAEYKLFRGTSFRNWLGQQGLSVIGMRGLRDELRAKLNNGAGSIKSPNRRR
ncbi:MAG: polysaccharide deacetylase family protein [Hyphomicrobiales bacterium]|nr:polysaccharide deacetylase family protein [Hyphomicrobiales bacterium]